MTFSKKIFIISKRCFFYAKSFSLISTALTLTLSPQGELSLTHNCPYLAACGILKPPLTVFDEIHLGAIFLFWWGGPPRPPRLSPCRAVRAARDGRPTNIFFPWS